MKMSLMKEVGYMYIFAKELISINKKLKKASKSAEKHKGRYHQAEEQKKPKHQIKHSKAVQEINNLMKKHNTVLTRLKNHNQRFAHYLRKEHEI